MAERDAQGRFVKGHEGMGGRPPRAVEERYLRALRKAVPIDEWITGVKAALREMQAGDISAFRALAVYLAGQPIQRVEQTIIPRSVILDEYQNDIDRAYAEAFAAESSDKGGEPAGSI